MKKDNFIPKKLKTPLSQLRRLKYLPRILTKVEKILFFLFFTVFIVSAIVSIFAWYHQQTIVVSARGGIIREGVVGQPRFINPVYAASNDIDRDLVNLVFSGLFKHNTDGEIIPDLVESYSIEKEGKIYNLFLRQGVFFHDNEKLTADDVLFTIRTIQNPDFQSPIQARWLGVETEKISEHQITLTLKNPYPGFLETLCLKILPAHIWREVSAENFPLSPHNFKPIGSGPFQFKDLSQDKTGRITSIVLERFSDYHSQKPFLNQISLLFFENKEQLFRAAENNIIDSLVISPTDAYRTVHNFNRFSFNLPRYFALFFNSKKNEFLKNENIRMALNYATDKKEIKEKVLYNKGAIVFSPFLPEIFNPTAPTPITFEPQKTEELLEKAGLTKKDGQWVRVRRAQTMNFERDITHGSRGQMVKHLQECLAGLEGIYPERKITGYFGAKTKAAVIRFQEKYFDEILRPANLTRGNGRVGPGTRKKLNKVCIIAPAESTPLKIIITTSQDQMLQETAKILKKQWGRVGVQVEIESLPISIIKQETIKERGYQALLFGHVLAIIPDPFSFWHSSQRNHPGLNLAMYNNRKVDKLLERARTEKDKQALAEKFQKAEKYLLEDMPAIFLYNPDFLYLASTEIKGIQGHLIPDPSQRFAGIRGWYVRTRRAWK